MRNFRLHKIMESLIWRVNVNTQELKKESIPQSWTRLGGRGLIARIIFDETDAKRETDNEV